MRPEGLPGRLSRASLPGRSANKKPCVAYPLRVLGCCNQQPFDAFVSDDALQPTLGIQHLYAVPCTIYGWDYKEDELGGLVSERPSSGWYAVGRLCLTLEVLGSGSALGVTALVAVVVVELLLLATGIVSLALAVLATRPARDELIARLSPRRTGRTGWIRVVSTARKVGDVLVLLPAGYAMLAGVYVVSWGVVLSAVVFASHAHRELGSEG